jgi:hypothetical protein
MNPPVQLRGHDQPYASLYEGKNHDGGGGSRGST